MAAEVCLLLMQSLTGDCEAEAIAPNLKMPSVVAESQTESAEAAVTTVANAIAPIDRQTTPQFAELCNRVEAEQLAVCALPAMARENGRGPRSSMRAPISRESAQPSPALAPTATAATLPITQPAPLNLPTTRRPVPTPVVQTPQFSLPTAVAAHPSTSARVPSYGVRPQSGSQLYRQRQLALQSGRSYTRVAPHAYADQWRTVSQQPTYEDWQRLLAQEARAIAHGQGRNQLEVIVGDSFGLWLPPEMLPRDRLWLNQSISGDTTAGILRRVSTFATTRATTIHLMAGTNDLKNGVPEAQIVSNLHRTVRILQQQHPQAKIVVYSVLPTRRAEIANDRVRSLNARIARIAQQSTVEYRDLHPSFQDEWGHLRPDLTTDGLHLNPQGYELWQQAILARAQ